MGIDIVEVERIARAVERHGDRFLARVFTEHEKEYAGGKKNATQSLAGRFAVKEAFMKALGEKLEWKEIEVRETKGKPFVLYHGTKYEGVSISHEKAYAVAVVII